MKTILKPYVLDFLKRQGYRYLLSRKDSANDAFQGYITFIPAVTRPAPLSPCIGFDSCFYIAGEAEELELLSDQSQISVILDHKDTTLLKKYLIAMPG